MKKAISAHKQVRLPEYHRMLSACFGEMSGRLRNLCFAGK